MTQDDMWSESDDSGDSVYEGQEAAHTDPQSESNDVEDTLHEAQGKAPNDAHSNSNNTRLVLGEVDKLFANSCIKDTQHLETATKQPSQGWQALRSKGIDVEKARLLIIEGHVRQDNAVQKTLMIYGRGVHVVVCGVASVAKPQLSLKRPLTQEDPNVCEAATTAILQAVNELDIHPLLGIVSPTGVASTYRDIPCVLYPIHKWLLNGPFVDKRAANEALSTSGEKWVSTRPSVLTHGASRGVDAVTEDIDANAAFGYMILREDVGLWMFERLMKGEADGYVRHNVSITY